MAAASVKRIAANKLSAAIRLVNQANAP